MIGRTPDLRISVNKLRQMGVSERTLEMWKKHMEENLAAGEDKIQKMMQRFAQWKLSIYFLERPRKSYVTVNGLFPIRRTHNGITLAYLLFDDRGFCVEAGWAGWLTAKTQGQQ